MNTFEKLDFIQSHLYLADVNTIDLFFQTLQNEEVLKSKLLSRASKSEEYIRNGKVYNRTDVENRLK